jgi:hypothetical protein
MLTLLNLIKPYLMSNKKHYTIGLQKAGDELSVCYWAFDRLEDAQSFMNLLKRGCTAYDVSIALTDEKLKLIDAWRMGDEFKKGSVILNKSDLC